MKPLLKLSWLGLALLLVCGTSLARATELARIGSTVITLEEFNKKYRENLKFFQFKVPTKAGVLDDLVKRELGIQEAKKEGLERDPEVIDRMNTVLYHALLDKRLSKEFEAIKVSDDDAKAYYLKYPEVRTSHIFVAVRPDAPADQAKKAYDKIRHIQQDLLNDGKMGFAEAAQRYSEGSAAPMGGDIDYQSREKLDPKYYETAIALRSPGKVSDIIRSQFGYHIIKLTAVRSWEDADKNAVKRSLFEEKKTQVFERYMARLRAQARVVTHPELIRD